MTAGAILGFMLPDWVFDDADHSFMAEAIAEAEDAARRREIPVGAVVTRAGEMPQRIWRIELDTGRREIWKELIPDDPVGALRIESIALSADGETYAFSYSLMTSSALYVVDGLFDPAPAR